MTDIEAIQKRISRRSYVGELSISHIDGIKKWVEKVNIESGLFIQFIEDGTALFGGLKKTYGIFSGVRSLLIVAGDKADHNLLEKAGYYGERLVLEATKLGLGTCWVAGTYDKKSVEKIIKEEHQLIAVIPVGPVNENTAFLERLVRSATHRKTKTLEQMANVSTPPPDWFWQGLKLVALAPSAINKQPVKFYWHNNTVSAWVKSDVDMEQVDMGIAKLHFEIGAGGKFEFGNGANFTKIEKDKKM